MAKHSARQTVQKDLCENPKIKEIVSKKLLDQLMNAVKIEAVMGETIVSLEPIKESPCPELYAVSFERSVRLTPLIRCRDCKHRIVNEHYGEKGYLKLKAMCELDTGDPFEFARDAGNDNWFCADGERKDGGPDEC